MLSLKMRKFIGSQGKLSKLIKPEGPDPDPDPDPDFPTHRQVQVQVQAIVEEVMTMRENVVIGMIG